MSKKYQALLITLTILLSLILLVYHQIDMFSDTPLHPQPEADNKEIEELIPLQLNTNNCWDKFEQEFIFGKWTHYGSDIPTYPTINLNREARFTLTYNIEDFEALNGGWDFDKKNQLLELSFDKSTSSWFEIFNLDLTAYEGIVYASGEERILKLKISGFSTETINCSEEMFFIDLMNIYLYKK